MCNNFDPMANVSKKCIIFHLDIVGPLYKSCDTMAAIQWPFLPWSDLAAISPELYLCVVSVFVIVSVYVFLIISVFVFAIQWCQFLRWSQLAAISPECCFSTFLQTHRQPD